MELLLGEKYQIVRMIAVRRQSTVYEAILKEKPGKSFAAKIERVDKPNQELYVENKVLKRLGNELELPGIPRVHAYQVEGRNNVLVTDLVDSDLEELRNACGGQFSLKTVLMLGEQILKRIEQIHEYRVLHRDIRPRKLAPGLGMHCQTIFLLGFGKTKKYIDSKGHHSLCKYGGAQIGCVCYSSLAADRGEGGGRRDDLESMIYTLIECTGKVLPWKGITAGSVEEKIKLVKQKKRETSAEEVCNGLPSQFTEALAYIRSLDFESKPDYALIKNMFRSVLNKQNLQLDFLYDWRLSKQSK
jgi:serine/threonine protein kinase